MKVLPSVLFLRKKRGKERRPAAANFSSVFLRLKRPSALTIISLGGPYTLTGTSTINRHQQHQQHQVPRGHPFGILLQVLFSMSNFFFMPTRPLQPSTAKLKTQPNDSGDLIISSNGWAEMKEKQATAYRRESVEAGRRASPVLDSGRPAPGTRRTRSTSSTLEGLANALDDLVWWGRTRRVLQQRAINLQLVKRLQ